MSQLTSCSERHPERDCNLYWAPAPQCHNNTGSTRTGGLVQRRPANSKQDLQVVFFPLRSGEDSSVAYLIVKRGSCGLSSTSICLRSHHTTPLLTSNQRKDIPMRLWFHLLCLILDFHSCFQA